MSTYTIQLPSYEPISLNDRQHHQQRARDVKRWRTESAFLIRQAQVPAMSHAYVTLDVYPPDRRRRDADNLVATLKPIIDGMRDAGVIDDDDPGRVSWRSPRIREPLRDPRFKLTPWHYRLTISDTPPGIGAHVAAVIDAYDDSARGGGTIAVGHAGLRHALDELRDAVREAS